MLNRFGIASKLLLAFGGTFALAIVIAVTGWFGFESISSSQRSVIGNAIPTLREAQRLAEVNAGIVASSSQLARSENNTERASINKYLDDSSQYLLRLVDDLERSNEQGLEFDELRSVVRSIRNNLLEQNALVEQKLRLRQQTEELSGQVLEAADQLTELSESLVANAASGATATSVGLYDLMDQEYASEQAYLALDRLVEVDLDGMERMFELRIRSARVASFIAQLNREVRSEQITELQQALRQNLAILARRLDDVNDPGRKAQATSLLNSIVEQTAHDNPSSLFNLRLSALEIDADIETLVGTNAALAEQLTNQVSEIVKSSGKTIDSTTALAVDALYSSRQRFLIIALITSAAVLMFFWWFLRSQVIQRMARLQQATLNIARGDLSYSPVVGGSDEVTDMGAALEVFRDNAIKKQQLENELLEYQQKLEQLVNQRTTQLEQANQDLAQSVKQHAEARERAEIANRAKTTFLATMSHELRTPVSGMIGTSRLLEQTGMSTDQSELVHALRSAGGSLLNIVNDVLDLAKFESGKLRLEYKTFDIHSMVLDLIALMRSPAEEKSLTLDYAIDPDINQYLVGDEERLRQVLTNLLGNAIKFTASGRVTLELEHIKQSSEQKCGIGFCVQDTGVGINPIHLDTIFEPFTQADASVSRRQGGIGLGLAICRRIVDAMGGQISVTSDPDNGTTFRVDIVFAVSEFRYLQPDSPDPASALEGMTVLVVEDDSVNRMVTRRFLEALNHSVIEAQDGYEALRKFDESDSIDIVLMDIGLPGMDGIDTTHYIHQRFDQGRNPIPVIAMSAHVFREEINDYLEAGMDGYLAKPFDVGQLDYVLKSALSATLKPVETSASTNKSDVLINVAVLDSDIEAIGQNAVADIIDLFLDSSGDIQNSINQAAKNIETGELHQLFHRLKSSSGHLGLDRLSRLSSRIENALIQNQSAASALTEFEFVFDESIKKLKEYRRRLN